MRKNADGQKPERIVRVDGAIPKKTVKKHRKLKYVTDKIITLAVITGIVSLILFIVVVPFYCNAREYGRRFGEATENIVGKAVGSYKGITEKIPEGREAGKKEGLSAKDINVEVVQIQSIGKLEVLEAKVALEDKLTIGDDYLGLFVYHGTAVFAVDLQEAKITDYDDKVEIDLALPEVDLNIDDSETEKIDEWQKHFYSGSADKGYQAEMNSRKIIENASKDKIINYNDIMEQAKDSAKKQVGYLVGAICGETKSVSVSFMQEEAD